VRDLAARKRLKWPSSSVGREPLLQLQEISGMILNFQWGAAEYAASDGEVAGVIVHLNGSIGHLYAWQVRWQRPARPNFEALAAWGNLHIGVTEALDDAPRPCLNVTLFI
jgi:hypothetical protein